ncbi:MAG TPA: hypothetical protein VF446_06365 [Trinickia sp.]
MRFADVVIADGPLCHRLTVALTRGDLDDGARKIDLSAALFELLGKTGGTAIKAKG